MTIIFIPGLGYDRRIFDQLSLDEFEVVYLDWIEPKMNENIKEYAARMFSPHHKLKDNVILVGHSFGGIIAQEIACAHNIEEVILLSSVVSRKEIPLRIRAIKLLGLHKLPIRKWSIKSVAVWGRYHGFDTNEKRKLFRNMLNRYSTHYFHWALKELSQWKGVALPETTRLFQVHGAKDQTFPVKRIQNPDYVLENGHHVFMLDQAAIISRIIKNEVGKGVKS